MARQIPVSALSVSSVRTLRMCAYKWRPQYVEKRYDPSGPAAVLGKAFGAAEAASDHHWIDSGVPLETPDVLDAYVQEFDYAASNDEVDWQGQQPGKVKDSAIPAIELYHGTVPALAAPVDAERQIRMDIEDVPFVAYLDVEREDGSVEDRKLTGRRKINVESAKGDLQATAYLAGRRAEGNPASRFTFDVLINKKDPETERIETTRTDGELDHFLLNILGAADEIDWRISTDTWSFAAEGSWFCSSKWCFAWSECPAGGLLRKRATEAVRRG